MMRRCTVCGGEFADKTSAHSRLAEKAVVPLFFNMLRQKCPWFLTV